MDIPEELMYTKTHEWVKILDDDTVTMGITDYAQSELGDLVFINLPEIDDNLEAGDYMADVESVKTVSDVYAPVSGHVDEINEDLIDQPELVNEHPYDAWFVKLTGVFDQDRLITADEYRTYIESREQED